MILVPVFIAGLAQFPIDVRKKITDFYF